MASAALGRPVQVASTSSGGDHRSWWVEDAHVLRCAPGVEAGARLMREVRLRRLLQEHSAVPVARSVASGTWRALAWTLDERLAGDPVDEVDSGGPGAVDGDLTAVVAALRGVGERWKDELALPPLDIPDLPQVVRDAVAACRALGYRDAAEWLAGHDARAAALGPTDDVAVLLHGDLKGEHLLVLDGRLSGVLDWADAGLGPASLDVEGLAVALGTPRGEAVAFAAGTPAAEVARGVLLARCRTSLRLAGLRRGEPSGPEPLLRRQWALAWTGVR